MPLPGPGAPSHRVSSRWCTGGEPRGARGARRGRRSRAHTTHLRPATTLRATGPTRYWVPYCSRVFPCLGTDTTSERRRPTLYDMRESQVPDSHSSPARIHSAEARSAKVPTLVPHPPAAAAGLLVITWVISPVDVPLVPAPARPAARLLAPAHALCPQRIELLCGLDGLEAQVAQTPLLVVLVLTW